MRLAYNVEKKELWFNLILKQFCQKKHSNTIELFYIFAVWSNPNFYTRWLYPWNVESEYFRRKWLILGH